MGAEKWWLTLLLLLIPLFQTRLCGFRSLAWKRPGSRLKRDCQRRHSPESRLACPRHSQRWECCPSGSCSAYRLFYRKKLSRTFPVMQADSATQAIGARLMGQSHRFDRHYPQTPPQTHPDQATPPRSPLTRAASHDQRYPRSEPPHRVREFLGS